MYGNSTRENRETPSIRVTGCATRRVEKGMSSKSTMHVGGESDGREVPTKCPNNSGQPPTEGMEGRRPTKENIEQPTPPRTQSRIGESRGLLGVREVARTRAPRRHSSKVGAVCSNSARTVLCGGRRVTVVPTATKSPHGLRGSEKSATESPRHKETVAMCVGRFR